MLFYLVHSLQIMKATFQSLSSLKTTFASNLSKIPLSSLSRFVSLLFPSLSPSPPFWKFEMGVKIEVLIEKNEK